MIPSSKNTLSSRERVLLALDHEETDRIPMGMVCSSINFPASRELDAYLRRERDVSLDCYLNAVVDIGTVNPDYRGPQLDSGQDMWGVIRKPVSFGLASYDEIAYYPLAGARTIDDLRRHRWPLTEWFDYSAIPYRIAFVRANGEKCAMAMNGNIFETSWYMRGFEKTFTDLVLSPELAHWTLKQVTDFYVDHFTEILTAGRGEIDLVMTADDIGGQNGLLMSLEMWEEFIKPCHVRLNKVIHELGARVIYHSDGGIMDAVAGLIDMGIDVLQALQFDAKGMDPAVLKQNYGDRLCFQGGVSVQKTLPFGTVEDVVHETESHITTLGKNGGYILGPSHAIQAGTPPENIAAMFDTALRFYPFGERKPS